MSVCYFCRGRASSTSTATTEDYLEEIRNEAIGGLAPNCSKIDCLCLLKTDCLDRIGEVATERIFGYQGDTKSGRNHYQLAVDRLREMLRLGNEPRCAAARRHLVVVFRCEGTRNPNPWQVGA